MSVSPESRWPTRRRDDAPARRQQCRAVSTVARPRSISSRLEVLIRFDAGRGHDVDAVSAQRVSSASTIGPRPRSRAHATVNLERRRPTIPSSGESLLAAASRPPSPRTISTLAPTAACSAGCSSKPSLVAPASGNDVRRQLGGFERRGRGTADRGDAHRPRLPMISRAPCSTAWTLTKTMRSCGRRRCRPRTARSATAGNRNRLPPCRTISRTVTAAWAARPRDEHAQPGERRHDLRNHVEGLGDARAVRRAARLRRRRADGPRAQRPSLHFARSRRP